MLLSHWRGLYSVVFYAALIFRPPSFKLNIRIVANTIYFYLIHNRLYVLKWIQKNSNKLEKKCTQLWRIILCEFIGMVIYLNNIWVLRCIPIILLCYDS